MNFTLNKYRQCYIDPLTHKIVWYKVSVNYIRFLHSHYENK
jgi:hypothetical protein